VTTLREAAKLLADLAGVEVGRETLRAHAESVRTELEGQHRAAMAYVEEAHESPAGEHDPAPGVLLVETDGVMVRYRDRHLDGARIESDWHEVKLGLVGGWQHGHLQHPSHVAARDPASAFARRLGAEAARRGALDVTEWHPWDGTPAQLRWYFCILVGWSLRGTIDRPHADARVPSRRARIGVQRGGPLTR
jgi:hypothetical protein